MTGAEIIVGDSLSVLRGMPDASVNVCVTSPPYWGLRDYGHGDQIGLEGTPEEYTENIVSVFSEVRRVLADDGTLWLNIGDSYATGGGSVGRSPGGGDQGARFLRMGHINTQPNRMPIEGLKPKDLVGIPWRVAFALQADGWYLRQDIIWHKPNPMPESVRDRCTKAHEYIFLLSKSPRYFYDADAVCEDAVSPEGPGNLRSKYVDAYEAGDEKLRTKAGLNKIGPRDTRNRRSVWPITTKPFKGAHFATFPPEIPELCIRAGSRVGGIVLDPFSGSGTTGDVAVRLRRGYVGIEINEEYASLSAGRIRSAAGMFAPVTMRVAA